MHRPKYRPWIRWPRMSGSGQPLGWKGRLLLAAALGIGLALLVVFALDSALRPAVTALAKAKVENAVTGIVNDAVLETLSAEAVAYSDLVTLERNSAGQVTVLTTDSAKMNALRAQILGSVLDKVESLDSEDLSVPLGSVTGLAAASDWGPDLPVRVLAAAAPEASFRNVFTSEGINQTLHQVMLDVQVDLTLLIPGGAVDTSVDAQVCVAETLLLGQVPDTYLELPGAS